MTYTAAKAARRSVLEPVEACGEGVRFRVASEEGATGAGVVVVDMGLSQFLRTAGALQIAASEWQIHPKRINKRSTNHPQSGGRYNLLEIAGEGGTVEHHIGWAFWAEIHRI